MKLQVVPFHFQQWLVLRTVFSLWLLTVPFGSAYAQTNITILKSFTSPPNNGIVPYGGLVADSNWVLYGSTAAGGISNQGTVFSIHSDGSGYRMIKELVGLSNGVTPYGELVLGTDGRLYGTTYNGGTSNLGIVFGMNTDGSGFTPLHNFTGGAEGQSPNVDLIEASDGLLYGVTYSGDSLHRGTLFKINKNGSGYSVMHVFTGNPDGQQVQCKLLEGSDGALYGTTQFGGTAIGGTVFAINKDGSGYFVLYNFGSPTANGYIPSGGVIEGIDHFLYGTTGSGGGSGYTGVLYKMDKFGGNYQILQRFPKNASGTGAPGGGLIKGTNGMIYGCTQHGGSDQQGTIFSINEDGADYVILRSFFYAGGDATGPLTPLLQLADGNFYSTTPYGGAAGIGCIYALSQSPLSPRLAMQSASSSSNVFQIAATSFIQYDVQRSTDLSSWPTIGTFTSPVGGQTNYSDLNPPPSAAFYRLHQH